MSILTPKEENVCSFTYDLSAMEQKWSWTRFLMTQGKIFSSTYVHDSECFEYRTFQSYEFYLRQLWKNQENPPGYVSTNAQRAAWWKKNTECMLKNESDTGEEMRRQMKI